MTISQSIRRSALVYANDQNFQVSQALRNQLEPIRISADAILFTDRIIDDGIIDWLISGELPSCLGKLKEMDNMLKPINLIPPVPCPARPSEAGEDKLAAALVFFDRHKSLFHFLTTPDVWQVSQQLLSWNRERLVHLPWGRAPQIGVLPKSHLWQKLGTPLSQ